jgi:hypothetical protein
VANVINGFSDLIVEVFGNERGGHAQGAVGMTGGHYGPLDRPAGGTARARLALLELAGRGGGTASDAARRELLDLGIPIKLPMSSVQRDQKNA